MLNSSNTNILDWSLLRTKLHDWYFEHQRDLPWRKTRDAYSIWLSEIILQQTRVEQGLPYYKRFLEKYPSVTDLAKAPQDEVLRAWEGLGYYSRARNLQSAAQTIVADFDSVFPKNYADIRSLKGVGDYTAAAIASFAQDLPYAVVDGNVNRVLSRIMAEETPINTSKGKRRFQCLADEFLDAKNPATHNQAIMEFGALQCVPKNPDCTICPLKEACKARALNRVADFPLKERKKYDRRRFLNYWYLKDEFHTILEKRESGIWKGLYQFPLHESEKPLSQEEAEVLITEKFEINILQSPRAYHLPMHKLSHQSLYITVWEIFSEDGPRKASSNSLKLIPFKDLKDFALPRPLRKFLDENQLTLPLD